MSHPISEEDVIKYLKGIKRDQGGRPKFTSALFETVRESFICSPIEPVIIAGYAGDEKILLAKRTWGPQKEWLNRLHIVGSILGYGDTSHMDAIVRVENKLGTRLEGIRFIAPCLHSTEPGGMENSQIYIARAKDPPVIGEYYRYADIAKGEVDVIDSHKPIVETAVGSYRKLLMKKEISPFMHYRSQGTTRRH